MPEPLTPEALAVRLEEGVRLSLGAASDADIEGARNLANYHRGRADGLTYGVRLLRELAPALADERNTLAADNARLAAEVTSLKGVTEELGRDVHRIARERDKARERQAETDREVSAALKTAARWQGENQRLIEERDDLAAQAATLKGEPPLTEADLIAHALAAEEGHANGTAHDAFGCRPCLLHARARLATLERDWNTARDLQLRYRAALEAIAECRAGMPYPVLAREALEGGHD